MHVYFAHRLPLAGWYIDKRQLWNGEYASDLGSQAVLKKLSGGGRCSAPDEMVTAHIPDSGILNPYQ